MADHKCWRCVYMTNIGPHDVRERIRCYPRMKEPGPAPFWMVGEGRPAVFHDMDSSETRCSDTCKRFRRASDVEE